MDDEPREERLQHPSLGRPSEVHESHLEWFLGLSVIEPLRVSTRSASKHYRSARAAARASAEETTPTNNRDKPRLQ